MYRIQKKRLILSIAAVSLLLFAAVSLLQTKKSYGTERCRVGKYKNLEVLISDPGEISDAEVKNMVQTISEQTGKPQTEEMEQVIFQALIQERLYAAETEKRRAVLREILKSSTIPQTVENPEEMLLLAVYDKEGLTLTEEEKSRGLDNLQQVFGVVSAEELEHFISPEEQLRIIKKEKTYEYLLKNNRFVVVPAAPLS